MTRHSGRALRTIGVSLALGSLLIGCRATTGRDAPPLPRVSLSEQVVNSRGPATNPIGAGQATPPLIFATYNLYCFGDVPGLRADLSRLGSVSAWAFQEVRTTAADEAAGSPATLRDVLPPGTWHVAWVPLNRLRGGEFEGQAIASRFPIRSAEVWPLPTRGGAAKRRVALAATLNVDGTDVLFVNTDHELSIFSADHGNARQTRGLLEHLGRAGNDGGAGPAVVAGDFNTAGCVPRLLSAPQERAQLRRAMAGARFVPAVPDRVPTFHAGPYSAALDHVFVRGLTVMESGVDDRARGSDHRPVWCRVESQ
jgi:endonuclease/exonuclease/phosphatase family metal-dependent hydrolase